MFFILPALPPFTQFLHMCCSSFLYAQRRADRFKCTKLISAHKNFGSALTRCSAAERGEGNKVAVLHRFPDCSVCEGIVHGICTGDIARANERYERLVTKSNGYLRYGSPVGIWDCHKAGTSVKTHGFLRNAATGAIFAYSNEKDDSWNIKKGV